MCAVLCVPRCISKTTHRPQLQSFAGVINKSGATAMLWMQVFPYAAMRCSVTCYTHAVLRAHVLPVIWRFNMQ